MKVSAVVISILPVAVPTTTAFTSVDRSSVAHSVALEILSRGAPAKENTSQSSFLAAQVATNVVATNVNTIPLAGAVVNDNPQPGPAASPSANEDTYGKVSINNLNKLYDLVVIGGGPAGYVGSVKAAQMGRRAIVIDKPKFESGVLPNGLDLYFGGPTGLYSKALRDAARNTNVSAMRAQGMDYDVIWKQITNSVVKLGMRNSEGLCRSLRRYGVDYLQGSAQLLGEGDEANVAAKEKFINDLDDLEDGVRSVRVSNSGVLDKNGNLMDISEVIVTGTHVLVSTGSKSTRLQGIPFDQSHRVFDSDTINTLGYLPRSVTISGLGIIGIEFANIFNALGVKDVKILVRGDSDSSAKKLGMDLDISRELMRLLKQSGVQILEGTTADEFLHVPTPGADDELIQLRLNDGSTLETDLFFAANGRYPVGKDEETDLLSAGVDVGERGNVDIDKKTLATSSKNVYAAGDILGPPALASSSKVQAIRAVSSMFREGDEYDAVLAGNHDDPLSIGVWTIPEMGYYGMTKEKAESQGYSVVEGSVGYDECLRGRVFAPDGLLKLVCDEKDGTVLGVHLIGKEAAEMVHYGMALVKGGISIFEILQTVYTAVTFHELFKQAAMDVNSKMDFGVEWQEIFKVLKCELDLDTSEEVLREKFDAIDKDGSGELDEDEMRGLFESMGRLVSKRIIANIMRLSDTDGNGTISFKEFKVIFDRVICHA